LRWADAFRRLGVRANADYPRDAERARQLGAEGIGLCRTEHMFFEEDRLPLVRTMILARTQEERQEALDKLLPLQREDFKGILRAMAGYPVVIRFIDPPIPLVAHPNELRVMRELLEAVAKEVMAREGVEIPVHFGAMIEIPRACVVADQIAEYAEFFSFGTNDLTQTVYGISRDDAEGKFLARYIEKGIIAENPFQTLDREGVGELMRLAVEKGRAAREDLELGICGEHGGDPQSIEFCHRIGLDYVSCSPFRVPVARLAAAQAALRERARVEERVHLQRNEATLPSTRAVSWPNGSRRREGAWRRAPSAPGSAGRIASRARWGSAASGAGRL